MYFSTQRLIENKYLLNANGVLNKYSKDEFETKNHPRFEVGVYINSNPFEIGILKNNFSRACLENT